MTKLSAVDGNGIEQINLVVDCESRTGTLTTVVGQSTLSLGTAIELAHVLLGGCDGLTVTEAS